MYIFFLAGSMLPYVDLLFDFKFCYVWSDIWIQLGLNWVICWNHRMKIRFILISAQRAISIEYTRNNIRILIF